MANPEWTDPLDWEDGFGVFVLRDGSWQEWTTGPESYVRRECAYLRNSLGLTASVFKRECAA